VRGLFDLAIELGSSWSMSELGWWLWRVGELKSAPSGALRPFALQIDGDWKGAAALWTEHGFRYEAALALTDSREELNLRTAAAALDRLRAVAPREFAHQQLRNIGAASIPRGRRPTTRTNPSGLTSREVEVLGMVEQGMRDVDIAKALFISSKTVSHHVSAILFKLEVASRREAAERARELFRRTPPVSGLV
jgi:DNA-binding CsgD family transcriptional regulator